MGTNPPWRLTVPKTIRGFSGSSAGKESAYNAGNPGSIPGSERSPTEEVGLVQFSSSVVSDSLRPHESQHARPPCPSPTPGVHTNPCPSSRWCHPAISSSVIPSPPAPNPSQHQGLFQWVNSSHEVAKVLAFQLQHQSFQWTPRADLPDDLLGDSKISPRQAL